jgi:hypothetical protein
MSTKKKVCLTVFGLLVVATGMFGTQVGFYSIQPIGVVPEGTTWLVWRATGEPFFNSADRVCLDRLGSVSLLSRAIALGQAPKDRVVFKLSYWEYAYKQSIGGRELDR